MKKIFLFILAVGLFSYTAQAQDVNVGDTFTIASVESNNYKYIKFPKSNFVIKKGGIVNFNNIQGAKVKVTAVDQKSDGSTVATIALASGKKFFNSHKYVTVIIPAAIDNKELIAE